jgi:hypothetical protein
MSSPPPVINRKRLWNHIKGDVLELLHISACLTCSACKCTVCVWSRSPHPPLPLPHTTTLPGLVYGQCIGDAVGLATEFRSKAETARWYSEGQFTGRTYTHSGRKDNMHSARWVGCRARIRLQAALGLGCAAHARSCGVHGPDLAACTACVVVSCCRVAGSWSRADFTDDSDQLFLVLDSLLDCRLEACPADFLTKLAAWIKHGFVGEDGKQLKRAMGIGRTVYSVVQVRCCAVRCGAVRCSAVQCSVCAWAAPTRGRGGGCVVVEPPTPSHVAST